MAFLAIFTFLFPHAATSCTRDLSCLMSCECVRVLSPDVFRSHQFVRVVELKSKNSMNFAFDSQSPFDSHSMNTASSTNTHTYSDTSIGGVSNASMHFGTTRRVVCERHSQKRGDFWHPHQSTFVSLITMTHRLIPNVACTWYHIISVHNAPFGSVWSHHVMTSEYDVSIMHVCEQIIYCITRTIDWMVPTIVWESRVCDLMHSIHAVSIERNSWCEAWDPKWTVQKLTKFCIFR